MHLVVFSHAPILKIKDQFNSYAPYVKEMNLWFENATNVTIVCPTQSSEPLLAAPFKNQDLNVLSIPTLHFKSKKLLLSIIRLPLIFFYVFKQMKKADHIHMRCPGNVGLIASIVQVFFPKKKKSAKYAGNWDPNSKQPLSYNIQQWLLKNTFLTKNMSTLVYGKWEGQTQNITPFFTASYSEKEKTEKRPSFSNPIRLLFVGTLTANKSPFYAIHCIEKLLEKNISIYLDIYGDGEQRIKLENYIKSNKLDANITLHGNCDSNVIANAYQSSHFIVLPSQSEGWPKVVAEAMWWGCIPLATPVSCVPWMLDHGKRGALLTMNLDKDSDSLKDLIEDKERCLVMSKKAQQWSQKYTTDGFEQAIKKLLE